MASRLVKRVQGLCLGVIALCMAASPTGAQAPDGLAGTWIWAVEGRNVFVLRVHPGRDQGGVIDRPELISLTPAAGSVQISNVRMPVVSQPLEAVGVDGDVLTLRYTDPDDPDKTREYAVALTGKDSAQMTLVGADGLPPLPLHRPRSATEVATDWDPGRSYGDRVATSQADNAELSALFSADQAARSGEGDIDWSVVSRQDADRRARVRELLDAGQVATADDYWRAAFVFQHGEAPEDYLLAHALAVTAVAKGKPDAAWIAAATLDRYLQAIGKAQIYGTQYQIPRNGDPVTMGDYDRQLISDAVRMAAGVPSIENQDAQREALEADRRAR